MSANVISFGNGRKADLNNKLCENLPGVTSARAAPIGWMESFHRWENDPAVVIAGGSSESVSSTFISKWVEIHFLSTPAGLSVSLGSMTDVMNSCDSAVGDFGVTGASEEQNISFQVSIWWTASWHGTLWFSCLFNVASTQSPCFLLLGLFIYLYLKNNVIITCYTV